MAVLNANKRFASARGKSAPMYKVPKNVRQSLNIDRMYKKGIAKLEPSHELVQEQLLPTIILINIIDLFE